MCPNSQERQQQGHVSIIRKGVNKVIKTDDGYHVEDEYEKLSALEKMKLILTEGALDLHLHTNASDGFDSAPTVLKLVMQMKLKSFAITDHDTLWGVKDVLMIIDKLKQMRVKNMPRFIPALELSVDMDGQEIHILAYYPSGGHQKIQDFLDQSKQERVTRNKVLCKRLTELGFPITYEDLTKEGGQVIGRMHVAMLMARRGFVSTVEDAFEKYLGEGQVAFIDRHHPKVESGIKAILETGGLPVLAHPGKYDWMQDEHDTTLVQSKLKRLKAMGCVGVEVIHGETTLAVSALIADLAKQLGLLRTVGSDYHGSNKPLVKIYTAEQNFSDYLLA